VFLQSDHGWAGYMHVLVPRLCSPETYSRIPKAGPVRVAGGDRASKEEGERKRCEERAWG
jgi:hypothetical protein